MPSRAFAGIQTIGAAARPVFGTTASSAASPQFDQFAGNQTGANPSQTTVPVTSSAGFHTGDSVLVCTSYPPAGPPNVGTVTSVTDSTHLIIRGLTANVASGAFVVLANQCQSVTIAPIVGNTGDCYIGTASTVSSSDTSVIAELPHPASTISAYNTFHAETTGISESYVLSDYWIAGTQNDKFLASYTV